MFGGNTKAGCPEVALSDGSCNVLLAQSHIKTLAGAAPSSSFSCAEGGSGGQSCNYCPAETRGPLLTQARSCLGTRGFVGPGHSMLGNLCNLRQVSCASMEADVALVGDTATFGTEGKQSQTQISATWRCTVGWTHPVCLGMCLQSITKYHPCAEMGHRAAMSDFPVSHRLGLCVTGESSLIPASRFAVTVVHWQFTGAQGSSETLWSLWD